MKQKHEFKSIVAETLLIPLYMRAKESRRDRSKDSDHAAGYEYVLDAKIIGKDAEKERRGSICDAGGE